MSVFNMLVLVIAAVVVTASSEAVSQQLLCTCTPAPVICEDSWTKFGKNCYKAFTEKKNMHDACLHCRSLDAELVSIHSAEENTFVRSLISNDKVSSGVARAFPGRPSGVPKWGRKWKTFEENKENLIEIKGNSEESGTLAHSGLWGWLRPWR